jgi:hypothetical protein
MPLPPELLRTQAHPEKRASLRLAKRPDLEESAGVALPFEIPVSAAVYLPPRVAYEVADAAAAGIAHGAVGERTA